MPRMHYVGLAKAALQRDAWRLYETGFSTELGLETYLERILDRCVDWFQATGASVFLRVAETEEFKLAAQAGTDSHIPADATIHAGSGIAGVSIQSGEPLLISDPLRHPLLEGHVNTHQVSLASSIVIPLHAPAEGCIGVLNLSRMAGATEFDRSDLERVAGLAQQISLAVSNARLFARLNESRVAESNARSKLESVVQSLGVSVLVFDDQLSITDCNRKGRELIGGPPTAWRGAFDKISPNLGRSVLQCLLKARSTDYVQVTARDAEQDRSWSIVCGPLPTGGATIVLEETTQQERNQRELARLARLAEIGQMTAAIAHEIRNPLTGISSAAQMIGTAPEQALEFSQIIEEEAQKLNSICEEFLEFSRPLVLRCRDFDLVSMASNLVKRHSAEFESKGVDIKLEIDREEPTIYGDILRLEQVLRNLLLNGLHACGQGESVTIRLTEAGFSVEDTGKGMREGDLEKLFTPFFTTKPNGTGLGLCNVRKIIDAHGGTISVSSQLGRGSRFDVFVGAGE